MATVNGLFDDGDYYTGPPLDDDMVSRAEQTLGVRLPRAYLQTLAQRNGGTLRNRCLATDFANSWAPDHIQVRALLGVGGRLGIETSPQLIAEWEYPDIGVVIADLPSGGHDTVMLDYSQSGPDGEPAVAYVDEDRVPRRIANSFEDFLQRLTPCDQFDAAE